MRKCNIHSRKLEQGWSGSARGSRALVRSNLVTVILHLSHRSDERNKFGEGGPEGFNIIADLEENIGLRLLRQTNTLGYLAVSLGKTWQRCLTTLTEYRLGRC